MNSKNNFFSKLETKIEKIMPNMHRLSDAPKTEKTPGINRKIKDKYGDWATLANLISVTGGITSITGLALLGSENGSTSREGLIALFAGRLMDNLDGYVAYRTDTMSLLGEKVDAVTDTSLMAIALPTLVLEGILNPIEGAFMAGVAIAKSGATAVATKNKYEIHTSRSGKNGAFLAWGGIALHGVAHVANNYHHETAANYTNWTATAINVASIAISAVAAKGYIRNARGLPE